MTAVLYLAASANAAAEIVAAGRDADVSVESRPRGVHVTAAGMKLEVELVTDVHVAVARALDRHFDAVIVDVGMVAAAGSGSPLRLLDGFLDGQRAERDRERRMRRDRVLAIVHDDGSALERALFAIGQRRVGGWLAGPGATPATRRRFIGALIHDLAAALKPAPSRKALCAAGGGISGVYYELGVMKCLEDTLGGFSVHDFDMYFGISAGAIVTSLLANGFALDELLAEIDPENEGGFPLELRLRDLTFPELPRRAWMVVQQLRAYFERVKFGEEQFAITPLLAQLAAIMGPFFRTGAKTARLAERFREPGRTDDFRELRKELYIGATDQDSREPVLFGDEPWRHIPISKAVQASAAIHPFLASVPIEGRRYTDGFVTKTTNIASAIERGANLVVIVDPFLPYIADRPGFNDRHSLFWVLVQDFKTMGYTRYENVSRQLAETFPQVTCVSFLPSNRMRYLLASNPLSTANFDAIVTQAYASTYRRLERMAYRFGPALAEHGIELKLDRAAKRVQIVDAMPAPAAAALCA